MDIALGIPGTLKIVPLLFNYPFIKLLIYQILSRMELPASKRNKTLSPA